MKQVIRREEGMRTAILVRDFITPFCDKVVIAGSLRRASSFVRDVDLLVSTANIQRLKDEIVTMENFSIIRNGNRNFSFGINEVQVDVVFIPEKSFGSALLYFTGSKNFNILCRRRAISKKMKLSEYGLFERESEKIISQSEEEILKILELSEFINPKTRNFKSR
jgi:DNA polymerase (family 10)